MTEQKHLESVEEWAKWLSVRQFIPVSEYLFTPAHDALMARWGYRYGFNRVVGPGERGQYVGYFAPESIDKNFVDGRKFAEENL